jgi:hypothetical protein
LEACCFEESLYLLLSDFRWDVRQH